MINILHVITTIRRGGAENHLVELVNQQVKNNYQVTVAYLKKDPYWQEKLESLGVKVIDLNVTSVYSYFINRNMRKLLKELKLDLVYKKMSLEHESWKHSRKSSIIVNRTNKWKSHLSEE